VLMSMIEKSLRDELADELRKAKLRRVSERMGEGLAEAIASGELVGKPDADELVSRLVGPIFFRLVMQQQPVSNAYLDRLLDQTLAPFTP
jgi:hypothetical protein